MARTFPSHDWHVQPSCQRPNRFPPERRVFSPEGSHVQLSSLRSTGRVRDPSPHKKFLCPRNLIKLLALLLACQPIVPTGFPLEIHIGSWTETVSLLRDRTADGGCPHASCGSSELSAHATERIFRYAVPQAQTSGSARALLARAFSAKAGRKTLG